MKLEQKILLTIKLEGGTLIRKSESETINATLNVAEELQFSNPTKWNSLSDKEKAALKKKHRTITSIYKGLESTPAYKKLKITKEAYDYFVSNEIPSFSKKKEWSQLNSTQKLEMHLSRISQSLGGKEFYYQILED